MSYEHLGKSSQRRNARISFRRLSTSLGMFLFIVGAAHLEGCAQPPQNPPAELLAFERAQPVVPSTSILSLDANVSANEAYRLIPGDVLELQLPALAVSQADAPTDKVQTLLCRVHDDGAIGLPTVGNIKVASRTLIDVESLLVDAYYPKYLRSRPTIVARVAEYHTTAVAVSGAVKDPGVYDLRSNEMSVPDLIAKAHGIVPDGAVEVRIRHQNAQAPVVVPLTDTPTQAQMTLRAGDMVEVVKAPQQAFTVLGLVKNPNVYPYPIGSKYTLARALATAGGTDPLTAPRYATIFRQDKSGQAFTRRCAIDPQVATADSAVAIKPGDVIVVETSADIQVRQVIFQMLRFGAGATYTFD